MAQEEHIDATYECVQPELGDQIGQLDVTGLAPDIRRRLQAHLAVCDSCRLTRSVARVLQEAAQDGSPALEAATMAGDWRRPAYLVWAGSLALAASLALVLLLPPGRLPGTLVRGAGEPAFVRPVEGEVVWSTTPQLAWRPVPGATSYRISVTGIDNPYRWQGESRTAALTLPPDHALRRGERVRAVVQTVPADLLPLGALSVTFRHEGLAAYLPYRLGVAPRASWVLGGAGLLSLLLALVLGRRRRPPVGA